MPMYDFEDGRGPVPAHQHPHGGGWVAYTARVADTAYVGVEARVYGYAQVYDRAQVFEYSQVYDYARVYGYAQVYGDAQVYGHGKVYGYVYTVTPKQATILMLKYGDKIRVESLSSRLIQVYDRDSITSHYITYKETTHVTQ